jgi:hypothetical protein
MYTLLTGKSLDVLSPTAREIAEGENVGSGLTYWQMHGVIPAKLGWPVIPDSSIFGFFGEGAFENGDPTDNHHADTPGEANEEHDLKNVFAPEHQVERHGCEPSTQPDWILMAGSL